MKQPVYNIRAAYTERIRPYINTQIIKVIVGQRRVGKSYLFYQLMDEVKKQFPKADILYITLNPQSKINKKSKALKIKNLQRFAV